MLSIHIATFNTPCLLQVGTKLNRRWAVTVRFWLFRCARSVCGQSRRQNSTRNNGTRNCHPGQAVASFAVWRSGVRTPPKVDGESRAYKWGRSTRRLTHTWSSSRFLPLRPTIRLETTTWTCWQRFITSFTEPTASICLPKSRRARWPSNVCSSTCGRVAWN